LLPTEVGLEANLYFSGPDGESVTAPAGQYLVELADDNHLRLIPIDGEPITVIATKSNHGEDIDGALALAEREGADVLHILLLMPDGVSYDAIASYSGVVKRGALGSPLPRPRVQSAFQQSKRRPVPSQAANSPASTASTQSPGDAAQDKAPWLVIDPAKRAYYVYSEYSVPNLRQQLSRPVTDERYRGFIRDRAASFRMGNRNVPFVINENAIVDAGGQTLDQSTTVALVDLERSPAMLNAILKGIGITRHGDFYVNAFLATSFAFNMDASKKAGRQQLDHKESLLVDVAKKDHSIVSQWKYADDKWTKLFEKRRTGSMSDPRSKLQEIARRQGSRQFGNFKHIALEEQSRAKPSRKTFGLRRGPSTPPMRCDKSGCSDARVQSRDASSSIDVLGVLECDSGGCKEAAAPSVSTRAVDGTYWAYGMGISVDGCTNYCSLIDCEKCCARHFAQQNAAIISAAIACHALSDFCPWCHAGCAAATAAASTMLATNDLLCMTINCVPRKESLAKNPMNCPVASSDAITPSVADGIQIFSAIYGANCNVPASKGDITRWAKSKCDGQPFCMFNLDWSIWGGHDPQPDLCKKRFDVRWVCPDGRMQSASVYHTIVPQPVALKCN
jgi:hypothetical protein